MTVESILIGVMLILIQLFALPIIRRTPFEEQKILSLSGGVAIAYVFVYILPTMHEEQDQLGGDLALDSELYFLGLIGLLVYYSVYKIAKTKHDQHRSTNTSYIVQISFFAFYTFMISYIVFASDVKTVEALFLWCCCWASLYRYLLSHWSWESNRSPSIRPLHSCHNNTHRCYCWYNRSFNRSICRFINRF